MKIFEKQLLVMFNVLKASLRIIGGMGGYSNEDLRDLVNEIVNQQSSELKEIK